MKQTTCSYLAKQAMKQSEGCKLRKGESTETSTGTLIHLYAESLSSWQDIEGVRLDRTPKPVTVENEEDRQNPTVKKLFIMSDLLNDKHTKNNPIILN